MQRKILFSIMTIALVGALIGGGIYAYFSDVETSTGNTFTAGTLNLKVGDDDPTTVSINITDVKPTDTGTAATWLTKNIGSISGTLDVSIGSIVNNENTLTEPEIAAGDATGGATEGELGSLLKVAIWLDVDESSTWNSGDIALQSDGTTLTSTGVESLPYDYLDNYGGDSHTSLITMTADDSLAGGTDEFQFMVDYDFPNDANDDRAQSDSAVFDVTFTLNQA
jgi:predicted ribosomally synthesized peptide with SipW-like signal peptide